MKKVGIGWIALILLGGSSLIALLAVWQPLFIFLPILVIIAIFILLLDLRSSITWVAAFTCATAPLLALAIPIQLPFVGLLNIFKLGLLLALCLLVLRILIYRESIFKIHLTRFVWRFEIFFLIWSAWLIFSLLWAPDKQSGAKYVITFLLMLTLMAMVVLGINNYESRLRVFCTAFGAVILLVLVQGILEQSIGFHIPQADVGVPIEGTILEREFAGTIYSFFNQPNDFATFLMIILPFSLLSIFLVRNKLIRIGAVVVTLVCLALTFFTVSRLNYVTAAIIIFATPFFTFVKRGALLEVLTAEVAIVAIGLFILMQALPNLISLLPKDSYDKVIGFVGEFGYGTSSTSVRLNLIRCAFQSIGDSYLIGLGAGGSASYLAGLQMTVLNFHSWWLEVLAINGVFIFIPYLAFYFSIMLRLYQRATTFKNSSIGLLGRALSLSLFGLIFSQNAPSSMIYFPAMWILFGLSLATLNVMSYRKRPCTS